MKKYIKTVLILANFALIIYLLWNNQKVTTEFRREKFKSDSLQFKIDSLMSEEQIRQIEIGRYEVILERAETEMSDECKTEFQQILKTIE